MGEDSSLTGREKYEQICNKLTGNNGLYHGYFDKMPRTERPCGYCNCSKHKGFICPSLLKEHNCIGKGCSCFKPFRDSDFFMERETKKKEKKLRKEVLSDKRLVRVTGAFLTSEAKCSVCGKVFNRVGVEGVLEYIRRLNKCGWVKSSESTYMCYKCIRRTKNEGCESILCKHVNRVSSDTSKV